MEILTLRKFDTKKAGGNRFNYSIFNAAGELIQTKKSGRNYVAVLISATGVFWFGRLDLIGTGDSKRVNTLAAETGLALLETVIDHLEVRRFLIRTGGRNYAGDPCHYYEIRKSVGLRIGFSTDPINVDFEPVVYKENPGVGFDRA